MSSIHIPGESAPYLPGKKVNSAVAILRTHLENFLDADVTLWVFNCASQIEMMRQKVEPWRVVETVGSQTLQGL